MRCDIMTEILFLSTMLRYDSASVVKSDVFEEIKGSAASSTTASQCGDRSRSSLLKIDGHHRKGKRLDRQRIFYTNGSAGYYGME